MANCPVLTGTDCSILPGGHLPYRRSRPYGDGLFCAFLRRFTMSWVPSLRGRIVPPRCKSLNRPAGPVLTGTDCSYANPDIDRTKSSRPYGDGLFFINAYAPFPAEVPSLRGRIVHSVTLWYGLECGPVLTGTDCSPCEHRADRKHRVPSLRGRIVPRTGQAPRQTECPVLTGTDCSFLLDAGTNENSSRPYGDGLFSWRDWCQNRRKVPSLRGRIVLVAVFVDVCDIRPVPTGTDCSCNNLFYVPLLLSRPYGDGLFWDRW